FKRAGQDILGRIVVSFQKGGHLTYELRLGKPCRGITPRDGKGRARNRARPQDRQLKEKTTQLRPRYWDAAPGSSCTEMSMRLILATWKSKLTWSPGLALAPYVTFRWVGVTHSIFRFIVAYW